jgi:hypothetical protein
LIALEISICNPRSCDTDIRSQLQAILDRAPRLYSLVIRASLSLLACIFDVTSLSVRRLDFQRSCEFSYESDLHKLVNSPLGIQCEVLEIRFIGQLDTLDFVCHTNENRLVAWLQHNIFPSLLTTIAGGGYLSVIQIWIR